MTFKRESLIFITVCVALLITLAGCGGSDEPQAQANNKTSQSSDAESIKPLSQQPQTLRRRINDLYAYLVKRPPDDDPRSVVEAYAKAVVQENQAAAEAFLSPDLRQQVKQGERLGFLPPLGQERPSGSFSQYDVVHKERRDDGRYWFIVKYTLKEGRSEMLESYIVETDQHESFGEIWVISDVSRAAMQEPPLPDEAPPVGSSK